MEKYFIENFEKLWTNDPILIRKLNDYNTIFKILKFGKLKNETIWQVMHDWINNDTFNRLTHFKQLFKNCFHFNYKSQQFFKTKIFLSDLFNLLPVKFQNELREFVDKTATSEFRRKKTVDVKQNLMFSRKTHQQLLINKSVLATNLNFAKKDARQLLLCIDVDLYNYDGSVEFYDHYYKSWHKSPISLKLPNRNEQKHFHLALLSNMLYAFGGIDNNRNPLNWMWSRDISDSSSQWKVKASMNQQRELFASVVLNNAIYVLGGWSKEDDSSLCSCERYDSQLNKWSIVANMNRERVVASAAVLNGCIYIAGGWNKKKESKPLGSVEKYNPESDTWSEVAPMITARIRFALASFAGSLWAIGGWDGNKVLSNVESYNPLTDTWQKQTPLKERRRFHAAIEFYGELYVIGGKNYNGLTKIVEKYVPPTEWIEDSYTPKTIIYPQLLTIPSAYFSFFSNSILPKKVNNSFKQKPVNKLFSLPVTITQTNEKKELLACINIYENSVEIYDSQHNNWYTLPVSLQLPNKQYGYQFALLDSTLYAFGGKDYDRYFTNLTWSRNLSDPLSKWIARADMNQGRIGFSSVVLNNTIYVLGGKKKNFSDPLCSCERYDRQLNQWSAVAHMNKARAEASASVIKGCIYIAGGWNEEGIFERSVEKYDPDSNKWSEVAPMTTARCNFAFTSFYDRLWAIGGRTDDNKAMSCVESYDPETDIWKKEAPLKEIRWSHSAIEFQEKLYVVGGKRKNDLTTVVEKYVPRIGWRKDSELIKKCEYPQLLTICSFILTTDSKENFINKKLH